MGYLRLYDYLSNIQSTQFNQLLQSNDALRVVKEATSEALIRSYITQKFDCDTEFMPTTIFKQTATYKAQDLVELNFTAYSPTTTYTAVGVDCVVNAGLAYVLKTSGATGVFDASKWTLLGTQYDLYYVALPYDEFNLYGFYQVGDIVYWKNKIYQCQIPSTLPNHIAQLQSITYANIPFNNTFPDDPLNGVANWGSGISYSVSGLVPNGTPPAAWTAGTYVSGSRVTLNGVIWYALTGTNVKPGTDWTKWVPQNWTFGDNRNAQLVECMVWVTIDKLAPLISPRTQPIFWDKKYSEYLTWLQMCAEGKVTLDAPLLQPAQGNRIRYGGNVKQQNTW